MSQTFPVVLRLPFRGRWMAQNSPANRVPSHGTHLFGTTFAIDFVAVDDVGRSATRTWRSALATELPTAFVGFGVPILAPISGTVMAVHDGEPDHEARRSAPALASYALTQASRVRAGVGAIAGNHVIISPTPSGPFVLVAHLRQGSIAVGIGDVVAAGEPVGLCGNSGNSTEPHVHVQATDSADPALARGLPIVFVHPDGAHSDWLPRNGDIFRST